MAIRHWLKNEAGVCLPFYPDEGERIAYMSNAIHVIDASGMPTKEEIDDAVYAIQQAFGVGYSPAMSKVLRWLETLAAE